MLYSTNNVQKEAEPAPCSVGMLLIDENNHHAYIAAKQALLVQQSHWANQHLSSGLTDGGGGGLRQQERKTLGGEKSYGSRLENSGGFTLPRITAGSQDLYWPTRSILIGGQLIIMGRRKANQICFLIGCWLLIELSIVQ